jgi:hypothetical protein
VFARGTLRHGKNPVFKGFLGWITALAVVRLATPYKTGHRPLFKTINLSSKRFERNEQP